MGAIAWKFSVSVPAKLGGTCPVRSKGLDLRAWEPDVLLVCPHHTGGLSGPALTSLVERVLWTSRLRMALVLMLSYGKNRSLACGGAEGAEGVSA